MGQLIMGSKATKHSTAGILFADGTEQDTASGLQVAPLVGVLVATGSNPSFVFTNNYVGATAPIVIITAVDGLDTSGKQWSVSVSGSPGAWTGFTINISGSVFGAFNYVVFGNPN